MAEEINIRINVETGGANQTVGQLKEDVQKVGEAAEKTGQSTKKWTGNLADTSKSIKELGLEGASRGIEKIGSGFNNLKLSNVTSGFRMLGAAIAANPIGAIATAVLSLVSAFGGLQVVLDFVLAPIKSLFSAFSSGASSIDSATQALDSYKGKLDEINNTSTVTNALLQAEIKIMEAQGKTAEEIAAKRKELLNDQLTQTTEQQKVTADYIDQLKFLQSQETKGSEKYVEYQGKINSAVKEVQNLKAQGISLDAEIRASDIKTQKQKDDNSKKEVKNVKEVSESKKSIAEKELRVLTEAQRAMVVVTEDASTARWQAEKNAIDIIEGFQIDRAKDLEISENGITIIKADNIEKRKKLDEDYYAYTNNLKTIDIEAVKLTNNDDVRLKKMASDAIIQIDNTTYQSKAEKRREEMRGLAEVASEVQKYAQMGAQIVTGIADLVFQHKKKNLEKGSAEEQKVAKKQFEFGRAVQLSLAIVDGFKAITTSLANSPIAFGPVPNPAGIASLAFASATTAINIARIAAMKFQPNPTPPSNNTPSAPSVGGTTPETPTFQPTQFFGLGQTVAGMGPEGGGPTRVYVTEGDISNTQNRVRVVENRARFG